MTPIRRQWQVKQVNGANADDQTLLATKNEAIGKGRDLAQAVRASQL